MQKIDFYAQVKNVLTNQYKGKQIMVKKLSKPDNFTDQWVVPCAEVNDQEGFFVTIVEAIPSTAGFYGDKEQSVLFKVEGANVDYVNASLFKDIIIKE